MDVRSQSALLGAIISLAIATSVLLGAQKRRLHRLFVVFALNLGLWFLARFFQEWLGGAFWQRVSLISAVLLPQGAVWFFRALLGDRKKPDPLSTTALVLGALALAAVLSPIFRHPVVGAAIFGYVFGLMAASLYLLWIRARHVESRLDRARLRYLVLGGLAALIFSGVDLLPAFGIDILPVGNVFTLIFLFVLSQTLIRYRLLDLYELLGRIAVLSALALTLAAIFYLLVAWVSKTGPVFLNAVVASLVILILFDPLRAKLEDRIGDIFFRERYELERHIAQLRRRLAHVLEVDEMARLLIAELERSRRVTHACIYLVDTDGRGYDLVAHLGPKPVERVEMAPARPLFNRLHRDESLVLEQLERELAERREGRDLREAETVEEVLRAMEAMNAGVALPITGEEGIVGVLCVKDERLRDPFAPAEVQLLKGLATQVAITIENSKLYERMNERDRLAALGEMAAGLAHEIRNPLGAIKAAAQYLTDPHAEGPPEGGARQFLDIIVEESDRLNRVVGSFLDYARPYKGNPGAVDVNAVLRRTLQVFEPERPDGLDVVQHLAARLPAVRIDSEQLRQVFLNLIQNAVQAMDGRGRLTVSTATRTVPRAVPASDGPDDMDRLVEIRFADTGPGISERVLKRLFIPFFTTKEQGTGLGLAISQRIVQNAGGTIEVRTQDGVGSTFVVVLPSMEDAARPVSRPPAAPEPSVPLVVNGRS